MGGWNGEYREERVGGVFFRGSSLYNIPLHCDLGGSLRSDLLPDKGKEYWFSRVLIKSHMIWKRTSRQ